MKYYHASSALKIIDAAQRGDAEVIGALLSGDPDLISTSDERGYTAGHWASYSDDISVLDVAIAANEQVVWEVRTSKGQTCLHIACMCGSRRVVRRMLDLSREGIIKYSLNGVNNDQETALHLAAAANHADLVGLLLGAGVDAALQDRWGRTAAEVAMENGYMETAQMIVEATGESIDSRRVNEREPVQMPAELRQRQQLLASELRTKLNLDSQPDGHMPDTSAFLAGFASVEPVVKTIFRQTQAGGRAGGSFGSDCSIAHVETPLTAPTSESTSTILATKALSKLVEYPGDPDELIKLLEDPCIALNGKDMYGTTALMKFAAWNKEDLVSILLPRLSSEEVNTAGGKDRLPCLHYCVDMDATRTMQVLLRDGRIDVFARDASG
eukprot:CAMPEP_0173273102 /NCGR_PEP_ID=MMETSP1143-20121109/1721_1 /TAXON_ID=483371 /ORGANISM="non described non described, Strain CCMP2298" /LENGTH=383 /DNA_ID=CAMNT_0014209811 /DNA_START=29 /DNA_END=1176 /DNA_ORIENTATION=+